MPKPRVYVRELPELELVVKVLRQHAADLLWEVRNNASSHDAALIDEAETALGLVQYLTEMRLKNPAQYSQTPARDQQKAPKISRPRDAQRVLGMLDSTLAAQERADD